MFQRLVAQILANSTLDWLAFVFGIVQVVLAWHNKKYNFIAGIISVSLYIFIFYKAGLFAESFLNVYYLLISIYGFAVWHKNIQVAQITNCTKQEWVKAFAILIIAFAIQWWILSKYTTSNVPIVDSLVSSLAWVGTWLLTKRKLQNWLWLNVSNAIAIPLFMHKNLHLVAVLYVVFFIIAIFGYKQWKKNVVI